MAQGQPGWVRLLARHHINTLLTFMNLFTGEQQ